jgi:hypothetical protein
MRNYSQHDRFAGRRLIVEALARSDRRLPVENAARAEVRRRLASNVWRDCWERQCRASGENAPAGDMPHLPEGELAAFCSGEHRAVFSDLFRLLSKLPARSLTAGTPCFGSLKGAVARNGQTCLVFDVSGQDVHVPLNLVGGGLLHRFSDKERRERASDLAVGELDRRAAALAPTFVFLNMIRPRDGHLFGTTRGEDYVRSFFRLVYPGGLVIRQQREDLWLGSSNSWAVMRMHPLSMTSFLAGGGWMAPTVAEALLLGRVTVVPSYPHEGAFRFISELRHFTNNGWEDLEIEQIQKDMVVFRGPVEDERKKRSFESMFMKVFPGYQPIVLGRTRRFDLRSR